MSVNIKLTVTDPAGKVADLNYSMSDSEFALLVDITDGWSKTIDNPSFDEELPEDAETNPKKISVSKVNGYREDRWKLIEAVEEQMKRWGRTSLSKAIKLQAAQQEKKSVSQAISNITRVEDGDIEEKVV